MSYLILTVLVLAGLVVFILAGVFLLEVLAAFRTVPVQPQAGLGGVVHGPRAIIIPAHNESSAVLSTIADAKAQIDPRDRLLVIADNCTDDTAAIARVAGAEVLERHEPLRRGKGFALAFALRHLCEAPPSSVIFIDADCRVAPGTIDALSVACEQNFRPVQALNLMTAPAGFEDSFRIPVFAWRVKNLVRPLGMRNLGLPCQITGTGMAFPWEIIRNMDLASGHIVEDLKLGLDLTAEGHSPMFLPWGGVTSEFPTSTTGMQTQRERWEGGHLSMIRRVALPLIVSAIRRRNFDLFVLAADMAVPPLTFLILLCLGMVGLTGAAALLGLSAVPLIISGIVLAALALAVLLCWIKVGRDLLPFSAATAVGPYLWRKMLLYSSIFRGRASSQWTRTERAIRGSNDPNGNDKDPTG